MSGNAKIFLKAGLTQGRDVNSRGKGLMHCDPPPFPPPTGNPDGDTRYKVAWTLGIFACRMK